MNSRIVCLLIYLPLTSSVSYECIREVCMISEDSVPFQNYNMWRSVIVRLMTLEDWASFRILWKLLLRMETFRIWHLSKISHHSPPFPLPTTSSPIFQIFQNWRISNTLTCGETELQILNSTDSDWDNSTGWRDEGSLWTTMCSIYLKINRAYPEWELLTYHAK